jgi:acyl-CoA reductase-like NAD-dependent aldehyde dehydrogenase
MIMVQLQQLQLLDRGNYDIVPNGTVGLIYPSNRQGIGTVNAMVQPIWGGNTLVFKVAPSASNTKTKYLYTF